MLPEQRHRIQPANVRRIFFNHVQLLTIWVEGETAIQNFARGNLDFLVRRIELLEIEGLLTLCLAYAVGEILAVGRNGGTQRATVERELAQRLQTKPVWFARAPPEKNAQGSQ